MDVNNISSIVALLAALSVASERLVEIIKGMSSFLNTQNPDPKMEGRRQALLHFLAVVAGIATTWLASSTGAVKSVIPSNPLAWAIIGLLASGGSGFWNSIQSYVNKAKNVKGAEADSKKLDVQIRTAALAAPK